MLAEVFGARPSDVEAMILARLEEGAGARRGGGRRSSARENRRHSLGIVEL